MASLSNINPDGAYDVTQRSLEDFQFDLENMLTMSHLVGKLTEERQRGLGDAGYPCRYQEQDCSRLRQNHSA